MDDKSKASWETFLNPETLRPNLIAASVYIAAFELLKATIVDRIKEFFTNGFDDEWVAHGPEISVGGALEESQPGLRIACVAQRKPSNRRYGHRRI